jgi:hypothetical protein
MMNPETDIFLHDLFVRCTGPEKMFITLTAIHPDGRHPTPSRHVPLGNRRALEDAWQHLLVANQRGWGAYLGIGTRQHGLGRWSRGGKSDLVALPAVFADLDEPDSALWRLTFFDLPPSCVARSGHGYHAYWFLETPTTDFVTADLIIRGLADHLHGDSALSVAQSMRLVGTVNTKPGRENQVCEVLSYHPEWRYALRDFRPYLAVPAAPVHHYRNSDHEIDFGHPDPDLHVLTDAVLRLLDGRVAGNGYIRARCPLPHDRDRPGMHFSYHPETGWGHCFGKHGKISPAELGQLLGVFSAGRLVHVAA